MTQMLEYHISMFYILLPAFLFITWRNIDIITLRLYLFDYMTGIFVLNALGIYLFLRNVKIDIEFYWSITYAKENSS